MKEITKKEFTGIFKEEFENFLRYKKALGYYKKIEGNLLYDYLALNRFLDSYKLEEIAITEEMTFAYVKNISGLTVSKWTVSATTLLMSFWSILKKRKEYPYLPEITVLLR